MVFLESEFLSRQFLFANNVVCSMSLRVTIRLILRIDRFSSRYQLIFGKRFSWRHRDVGLRFGVHAHYGTNFHSESYLVAFP